MGRLLNSDFESGEGWSFSGGAILTSDYPARSGLFTARIPFLSGLPPTLGQVIQEFSCTPGELVLLSVWVRRIGDGPGIGLYGDGTLIDSIAPGEEAADWTLLSGLHECTAATCQLKILAIAGLTNGSFIADDAEAEGIVATAHNTFELFKALYTQLKTINGSTGGYWHEVGERVYPRYIDPLAEGGAPERPYVCVYFAEKGGYDEITGQSVDVPISPLVTVFLEENESDDVDQGIAADACKWHDDLLRCLMPENGRRWNIGSQIVHDANPIEKQIFTTALNGIIPYVAIRVQLMTTVTRAELGSGA